MYICTNDGIVNIEWVFVIDICSVFHSREFITFGFRYFTLLTPLIYNSKTIFLHLLFELNSKKIV